ncbi:MAG: ABC transporter substrate-binding protein [Mesorhizobium sp.]|nr:ABC transporter substrate-binding protein [Mesorhizobium sp.]RWM71783.1 MAG: ABC transporter substrate-binding protein [Mesorhizobium sp.]RWN52219.1 MAG: ABC transporter substrate-binding protein [Mesorhizobium sp.]RWN61096.1 MAG: ABC transporter substrate-binding protein [Mesorhizobium sp.]TIO13802.1 MAG: ABC transporter substrate-binding protein [Mesorhizobium sp.]TIR30057.1 MAG: ABC transporter substrate-binding protein [Mesorhizobium sp.]
MSKASISVGVVTALSLLLLQTMAHAQETLTIATYGGAWAKALSEAALKPIAKTLGITIKEVTISSANEVKLQVNAGAVAIDIVDMGAFDCELGAKQALWEKLDYGRVDATSLDPSLVNEYWVGGPSYYSTVLAWSKKKYGDNPPKNWADFWDVKKFPGTRAFRNNPVGTLEFALIADGVAPDRLYPLDVDRAFAKLREIKPYITVWWGSGAQSAQLLHDGEVDMLSIWNGRVSTVIANGAEVAFTYNQAQLNADCMVIPRGSKNKELAEKVINLILTPELQANLPALIDYGPVNPNAFELGKITSKQAAASNSSPENAKYQTLLRFDWWGENLAAIQPRWDAFIRE